MMLIRTALLLMMGLLLVQPAPAQSTSPLADAPPFHTAARQYLAGDFPRALATVEAGLRADPGNPRLLALRAKIERQRPPSNRNNAPQQPSSDKDGPAQEGKRGSEQQKQNDSSSEEENTSDGREEREEDAPETPAQRSPSPGGDATEETPPDGEATEGRNFSEGTPLSPSEAARILRALENQEKQLLRQVQKRPSRSRHVEKDW